MLATFALSQPLSVTWAQKTTISDWLSYTKENSVEIDRQTDYVPVTLHTLLQQADLIGEFRVAAVRSFVSKDQAEVNTKVLLTPVKVLRDDRDRYHRSQVFRGSTVVVLRKDGAIKIGERNVRFWQPHFPYFKHGERFYLFLKYEPDLKVFTFPFGPYSVFSIDDDQVHALAPVGELSQKFKNVTKPKFEDTLRDKVRNSD